MTSTFGGFLLIIIAAIGSVLLTAGMSMSLLISLLLALLVLGLLVNGKSDNGMLLVGLVLTMAILAGVAWGLDFLFDWLIR